MAILTKSSPFGPLDIFEVYEEYDGPRLFACRTAAGFYFLVLWAGETDNSDEYILLAVSPRRLQFIRAGEIELRAAFSEPEDGQLGKLRVSKDGETSSKYETVPMALIDMDLLPASGEVLVMSAAPIPLTQSSTKEAAIALKRDIIDMRFRSDEDGRQMSIAGIARSLSAFQELLNEVTGHLSLGVGVRFLTRSLTDATLLDVLPGSLVVRLAFPHPASMEATELQQRVVGQFMQGLRDKTLEPTVKAERALRKLLKTFGEGESLDISWASVNESQEIVTVSKQDLTEAAFESRTRLTPPSEVSLFQGEVGKLLPADLKARGFEIGIFKVVDLNNQTFEFFVPERESSIRGRIAARTLNKIQRITLNKVYIVQLQSKDGQLEMVDVRVARNPS